MRKVVNIAVPAAIRSARGRAVKPRTKPREDAHRHPPFMFRTHQFVGQPNSAKARSLERMGNPSTNDWAANTRSNGSRCLAVSVPALIACVELIGNSATRFRLPLYATISIYPMAGSPANTFKDAHDAVPPLCALRHPDSCSSSNHVLHSTPDYSEAPLNQILHKTG